MTRNSTRTLREKKDRECREVQEPLNGWKRAPGSDFAAKQGQKLRRRIEWTTGIRRS